MPGTVEGEPRKLIILGTGGNCVDILEAVIELADLPGSLSFECVGFLDDDREKGGREFHGVPILGPLDSAARFPDCQFVNGIGSPESYSRKEAIIGRTGLTLERFATIVHPTASVSRSADVGKGTVILQNVTIASGVRLGAHVMVLPNSVLSHDVSVGDFTCVASAVAVAGGVAVGRGCYLGTNASIRGGASIGDGALVGMGSVVLGSVGAGSVVVGNPARLLRRVPDAKRS